VRATVSETASDARLGPADSPRVLRAAGPTLLDRLIDFVIGAVLFALFMAVLFSGVDAGDAKRT
jgi:hypothetical protein